MTNSSRYVDRIRYDAVVVGAGIFGSLVAKRLGERGWRVLVLEAGTPTVGTWEGYTAAVNEFRAALHKSPNSPFMPNPAAPSPSNTDPTGYFVQDPQHPYASDYLRTLGGTVMHWEAATPRMHEKDSLTKTAYDHGLDWPFSTEKKNGEVVLTEEVRKNLCEYYEQAEFELGVSGDALALKDSGLMSDGYVYPMRKIPQSHLDKVIEDGLVKSGNAPIEYAGKWEVYPKVVPAPQARNGTPDPDYDQGRGYRPVGAVGVPNYGERCVGNSSCIPICPVQAKYTPLRTQAQFDRELVTVATQSVVTRVLFNNLQNGRATGVEYKVYDDPRSSAATTHCVEADIVVLATHAIENAKLLLASGVDNKRIGQHLMDHPLVVTQALMPAGASIGPHRGPPATSFIDAFRDGQWRKEFASFRIGIFNWGWGFQAESFSSEVKALVDRGSLNPDRPGKPVIGRELRRQLTEHLPRQFQLELMLEQTADPGNRVTIDRNYRDHLGNFRPVIEYGVDPYVTTGAQKAVEVSQKILSRLGATEYNYTKAQPPRHKGDEAVITTIKVGKYYYDILGARHGAGTHVMGKDRTDSVVDQYQCVHGHANLFAIGCGSMPSIGTSNPTLTGAMAALRSADHIHSKLLAHNRPVSLAPRFGATTGNGANVPGQRVGDDAAADTAGLLTGKDR